MRGRCKNSSAGVAMIIAGGLMLGGGVLWSAGLVRFANSIPDTVSDPASRTDAIVVLTGGSDRLATGLRLLAENKADRMFVSGVHPSVDVAKLMRLAGRPLTELDGRVEAGHGALDTGGNAVETAAWMREQGYRSLRLVTGNYHMPRSLFEFRMALPEAEVIPNPVFPNHVHQGSWWLRPGTTALIISEYNKYLLASFEHWAGALLYGESTPRGIG